MRRTVGLQLLLFFYPSSREPNQDHFCCSSKELETSAQAQTSTKTSAMLCSLALITIVLGIITRSYASISDNPIICAAGCDVWYFYNIYGAGLGWLVMQGEPEDTNTVFFDPDIPPRDMSNFNTQWTLVSEGDFDGYVIQSRVDFGVAFSNLRNSYCNTNNTFQEWIWLKGVPASTAQTWSLGTNSDGTNFLKSNANCGNSMLDYLGSTTDNPQGSLIFYGWGPPTAETATATLC